MPVRALAAFVTARSAHADLPGDLHWDTADPGWPTGLYSALLGPLATGRRGLLTRGALAPAPAWRLLDRYRVTHLHAGPAHFRAMAGGGPPPSGLALRHASSTGEPLPPDLVTWAAEVLGVALHDRYGQAELGTVLADPEPDGGGCRPGTLGRPLPGWTVAVLGDEAPSRPRPAPSAGSPSTPVQPADVVLRLPRRRRQRVVGSPAVHPGRPLVPHRRRGGRRRRGLPPLLRPDRRRDRHRAGTGSPRSRWRVC